MDEMMDWEIPTLFDMMVWSDKTSWEQCRWQMYMSAAPYFKKGQRLKIHDFFPLWFDDNDALQQQKRDISNNEIETMRKTAENISNVLNGKERLKH